MRKEIDNNEKIKELIKEYQEKGGDDIFYLILEETKFLKQFSINKIQKPNSITRKELEHECDIALYKAVMSYDTNVNGKVTNYIINSMTRAMIRYVAEYQNIIHIPWRKLNLFGKIRTYVNEYETTNGNKPSKETIVKNLKKFGITDKDVEYYLNLNFTNMPISIDEIIEKVNDIENDKDEEMEQELMQAISLLKPNEIEIIKDVYYDNKTFAMIANERECSRENIRQKHNRAIEKLRKLYKEKRK